MTNSSYNGGLVRENGALSFSRIFQAGHGVAGNQPETMYHVFERAMSRRDVATGKVNLSEKPDYASSGPQSVRNVTNKVPEPERSTCYLGLAPISCTVEQLAALADGSAVVEDWIVVKPEGTRGGLTAEDDAADDETGAGVRNGGAMLVSLLVACGLSLEMM